MNLLQRIKRQMPRLYRMELYQKFETEHFRTRGDGKKSFWSRSDADAIQKAQQHPMETIEEMKGRLRMSGTYYAECGLDRVFPGPKADLGCFQHTESIHEEGAEEIIEIDCGNGMSIGVQRQMAHMIVVPSKEESRSK